jgi:hypothetical protein
LIVQRDAKFGIYYGTGYADQGAFSQVQALMKFIEMVKSHNGIGLSVSTIKPLVSHTLSMFEKPVFLDRVEYEEEKLMLNGKRVFEHLKGEMLLVGGR